VIENVIQSSIVTYQSIVELRSTAPTLCIAQCRAKLDSTHAVQGPMSR